MRRRVLSFLLSTRFWDYSDRGAASTTRWIFYDYKDRNIPDTNDELEGIFSDIGERHWAELEAEAQCAEIGRASCRERV